MKADTLTRFFCLLLAAFISSYNADASGKLSTEDVRIIIVEIPNNPDDAPRSVVPFIAEYNELMSSIVLTCISPCGDVGISLVSTAGDSYQTVFDTDDVTILIPVSGNTGYYTLTLVTSDNTVFEGNFVI